MFENVFANVEEKIKRYPIKTWDKIPIDTLAHVNLMKAQRTVDLFEVLNSRKFDEPINKELRHHLADELLDIISYAAKIWEREFGVPAVPIGETLRGK